MYPGDGCVMCYTKTSSVELKIKGGTTPPPKKKERKKEGRKEGKSKRWQSVRRPFKKSGTCVGGWGGETRVRRKRRSRRRRKKRTGLP
jgi:hypothetical protein